MVQKSAMCGWKFCLRCRRRPRWRWRWRSAAT
jgi:hypothetical protein